MRLRAIITNPGALLRALVTAVSVSAFLAVWLLKVPGHTLVIAALSAAFVTPLILGWVDDWPGVLAAAVLAGIAIVLVALAVGQTHWGICTGYPGGGDRPCQGRLTWFCGPLIFGATLFWGGVGSATREVLKGPRSPA